MTKKDFTGLVAKHSNLTKRDASLFLDGLTEALKEAFIKGEDVKIVGLGIFSAEIVPAHEGRNPATGETIQIEEKKRPKLAFSKGFKESINEL